MDKCSTARHPMSAQQRLSPTSRGTISLKKSTLPGEHSAHRLAAHQPACHKQADQNPLGGTPKAFLGSCIGTPCVPQLQGLGCEPASAAPHHPDPGRFHFVNVALRDVRARRLALTPTSHLRCFCRPPQKGGQKKRAPNKGGLPARDSPGPKHSRN